MLVSNAKLASVSLLGQQLPDCRAEGRLWCPASVAVSLEPHFPCLTFSSLPKIYTHNLKAYSPAALTFRLLPSFINLRHPDRSRLCVTSELHGSQVAAGGNCSQNARRQTLRLLRGAAAARPVGLPGVSFMTVTATFKSSCGQTDR